MEKGFGWGEGTHKHQNHRHKHHRHQQGHYLYNTVDDNNQAHFFVGRTYLLSVSEVHGVVLPPLEPVVAQLLEVLAQGQRRLVLVGQVLEGFHDVGVHVLLDARER